MKMVNSNNIQYYDIAKKQNWTDTLFCRFLQMWLSNARIMSTKFIKNFYWPSLRTTFLWSPANRWETFPCWIYLYVRILPSYCTVCSLRWLVQLNKFLSMSDWRNWTHLMSRPYYTSSTTASWSWASTICWAYGPRLRHWVWSTSRPLYSSFTINSSARPTWSIWLSLQKANRWRICFSTRGRCLSPAFTITSTAAISSIGNQNGCWICWITRTYQSRYYFVSQKSSTWCSWKETFLLSVGIGSVWGSTTLAKLSAGRAVWQYSSCANHRSMDLHDTWGNGGMREGGPCFNGSPRSTWTRFRCKLVRKIFDSLLWGQILQYSLWYLPMLVTRYLSVRLNLWADAVARLNLLRILYTVHSTRSAEHDRFKQSISFHLISAIKIELQAWADTRENTVIWNKQCSVQYSTAIIVWRTQKSW